MNHAARLLIMLLFAALSAHPGGPQVASSPETGLTPPSIRRDSLGEIVDARMRWTLYYAAVAIEAFYGSNGDRYAGATLRILENFGFRPEPGVTLQILDATDRHYLLSARASGGAFESWVFDSNDAKVKPGPR